ncbi:MAG: hypothetical protein PHW00_02730 [Clostridia bacterium]|nr:hypothetical protein [Clostridia bacterium]
MTNNDKFYGDLVQEIKEDFEQRQRQRRAYENSWQLNINFVSGNQYCSVTPQGDIIEQDKYYYWQEKQVYNHIAPIVETRMARLSHIRPKMTVRPFSNTDEDIESSKLATKILCATMESVNYDRLIDSATAWSEVTGTAFYKVTWESQYGQTLLEDGKEYKTGDVSITVCSPFEIYPDSNVAEDIEQCNSIIHAKAYDIADIKSIWGVEVPGEDIKVFGYDGSACNGGYGYNSATPFVCDEVKKNHAIVIERYTKPSQQYPNGQLTIIARDSILYHGELPYIEHGIIYPFIKQVCHRQVGCFWGSSIVERIIPLQRSYNAIKNRKNEFLSRIAMGVLTVEDGSVDTDNLEEEGLSPGKVIIYRQGASKPALLDAGNVPNDFMYEEDRLLNEFIVISGVSELARNSTTPSQITSGVALQLLIEQDEQRLSSTANNIKIAIKQIGKHIINLYRQYATALRLAKTVSNDGSVEIYYFTNADLRSDDIVFETENEITDSPANRRNIVMELLRSGLLQDENGKMRESTKVKVMEMLGLGNWEHAKDIESLHLARADKENLEMTTAQVPLTVDNHNLHIDSHIAYVIDINNQLNDKRKSVILEHIAMHKQLAQGGIV